jgi:hypothetical protein
VRDALYNDVLRIAPEKLRVITPDVGGGQYGNPPGEWQRPRRFRLSSSRAPIR